MKIAGKTAIVTGGGSGMGAATACYLSQLGANVAIFDIHQDAAEGTASKMGGLAIKCDVTQESDVMNALEQTSQLLGAPYVCINCAGIAPAKRIVGREGAMPLAEFEKVIAVNLVGTFNLLRLVAAQMIKNEPVDEDQERGIIVNTASIAAYEGQIGQSAYSASKAAICGLTLPSARELAQFAIRVMTIAPGLVRTPLLDGLAKGVEEGLTGNIPFPKRLGHPRDYALLVAHIIENAYLNGEVIRLDAGLRMQAK